MDISPNIAEILKQQFSKPLQLDPLPELHPRLKHIPHAPKRNPNLTEDEQKLFQNTCETTIGDGLIRDGKN